MFKWIFLSLLLSRVLWEILLEVVNLFHSTNSSEIPELLKDCFDQSDFDRSKRYLKEKVTLKIIAEATQFFVVLYLVLHGFTHLEVFFSKYSPFLQALFFFGTTGLIFYLLNLIFKIYSTFVIEAKYGFNTSSKKTFVLDQILTIMLFIGFGLLAVFVLLRLLSRQIWWWQGSILAFCLLLFFWFIQPILIAPLFYKFSKLEDEELENEIRKLLVKTDIKIPNIYKVNASKRTKKQNAYLTGIGRSRRLVLYDTVLNYPEDEILAIVGHELGHHVKKHIQKDILLFSIYATVMLYLANAVYQYLLQTRTFQIQEPHTVFLYSLLFVSFVHYLLQPVLNYISRKMEFEADRYSAQLLESPIPMISALKRLIKGNLSNPNPLPLYKVWYYTHPAPQERIARLLIKGS
ncbi:M48 family metallopeptidase [Pseudothermotoga sp. U03pept]|uniref:M48 family metallopeptidase n=1 Tax=Pseudothermotoga sp. U03pept TaxID=3447012 RepID=UPI003EFD40AC